MKTIKLLFIPLFLSIVFTACTSKTQVEVLDSSKEDVSKLLNKLIQKEKEIIKLSQQLEECKSNK